MTGDLDVAELRTPVAGMLAIVAGNRLQDFFLLEEGRRFAGAENRVGFVVGSGTFRPPSLLAPPEFQELVQVYRQAAGNRVFFRGFLVQGRRFRNASLILALEPLPAPRTLPVLLLFLAYAVFSFRALVALHRLMASEAVLRFSLRSRLAGLFFCGSILPLCASLFIGGLFLELKAGELALAAGQDAEETLDEIDRGFERELQKRQLQYRDLVREFSTTKDIGQFQRAMREFQDRYQLDDVFLVSSQSQLLIQRTTRDPDFGVMTRLPLARRREFFDVSRRFGRGAIAYDDARFLFQGYGAEHEATRLRVLREHHERMARFLPRLGADVMNYVNRLNGHEALAPARAADMVFEDLLEEEGASTFRILKLSLGKLLESTANKASGFLYNDVLCDSRGEAQYYLMLYHNFLSLEREYMDTVFADDARFTGDGEIRAIGWGFAFSPSYPMTDDGWSQELHERLARSGLRRMVTRISTDAGEREVIIRKSRAINGFDLIHVTWPGGVTRDLEPWRERVFTIILVAAVFSLLLGFLLLRHVLDPIQALAQGVTALREKRFDHRVRVSSPDEFGTLCRLLNRTIEHLEGMEMASAVQTTLFPTGPLTIGPYEILGMNVMTQGIGGDYYDYFPLPDGRAVVILGDVSGHGLSGALVTAMAKGACVILCRLFLHDPMQALTHLNVILFDLLRKKKAMTCLMAFLDPATGDLAICNAGQTSPILLPRSGPPGFLNLGSFPLAISKKRTFPTRTVPVDADTVLFYTDGLVEALTPLGKPVGFDRFMELAHAGIGEDPKAPLAAVFREVRRVTGDLPWDDDATAVLIRRRP